MAWFHKDLMVCGMLPVFLKIQMQCLFTNISSNQVWVQCVKTSKLVRFSGNTTQTLTCNKRKKKKKKKRVCGHSLSNNHEVEPTNTGIHSLQSLSMGVSYNSHVKPTRCYWETWSPCWSNKNCKWGKYTQNMYSTGFGNTLFSDTGLLVYMCLYMSTLKIDLWCLSVSLGPINVSQEFLRNSRWNRSY